MPPLTAAQSMLVISPADDAYQVFPGSGKGRRRTWPQLFVRLCFRLNEEGLERNGLVLVSLRVSWRRHRGQLRRGER